MCPPKWKFGLIKCLLHNAYMISSGWCIMTKEFEFLRNLFIKNGYPDKIVPFVSTKVTVWEIYPHYKDKSEEGVSDNNISHTICWIAFNIFTMQQLMKENFGIAVQVVFITWKVKNYFFPCITPSPLLANVVYRFQWLSDSNKACIGKTIRHLTTRVKEHCQGPSAIQSHLDNCNVCKENISCQSFAIMDCGQTDLDITIKEELYITCRSHKLLLNKQLRSKGSFVLLNVEGFFKLVII